MDHKEPSDLRLEPQNRLCPICDAYSIRQLPAPIREEMGLRIVDNCAQEHIM